MNNSSERKFQEEDEEQTSLELNETDDQVSELTHFKKLSLGRANRAPQPPPPQLFTSNISLNKLDQMVKKNPTHHRQVSTESKPSQEDEELFLAPRVERFLSVVEIPAEILMYMQMAEANAAAQRRAEAEKKAQAEAAAANSGRHGAFGKRFAAHNHRAKPKVIDNDKDLIRRLQGSGLNQAAKREIIRDIIKHFDMKKYLNDFKERNIIEINFDNRKPDTRPIRNRLLSLMNSDTIRINDAKYMKELANKLENNYKEKQRRRMEELEEREKKRERELIIKGLMNEEDSLYKHEQDSSRIEISSIGSIGSSSLSPRKTSPLNNTFIARYKKKHGSAPPTDITPYRLPKLKR